jgi:hypothetical protein
MEPEGSFPCSQDLAIETSQILLNPVATIKSYLFNTQITLYCLYAVVSFLHVFPLISMNEKVHLL